MQPQQPKSPVFVVLLNLNRWRDTVECLESVYRSDYPDVRAIVVDNGSADDSVAALARWAAGQQPFERPASETLAPLSWPPVPKPVAHDVIRPDASRDTGDGLKKLTIVANPTNQGFSAGNNIALRLLLDTAHSGYALLLNNDMVVAPRTVSALVEGLETDARIGAIGGVLFDYADPDTVQMVGGATSTTLGMQGVFGAGLKRGRIPAATELGFVGGGLLLTRLATLRHVGLLDESFFLYGEDYDWGQRMRDCGYRLTYAPDAEAWHKGGVTAVMGSPFQDYHMVRSTLAYTRKHTPHLVPAAFGLTFLRALAPKIVRGQWERARAVLNAYADFVRR